MINTGGIYLSVSVFSEPIYYTSIMQRDHQIENRQTDEQNSQ